MFCIKCGNKIEGNMKFCPKCGAELPVIENNSSNTNNSSNIPTENVKVAENITNTNTEESKKKKNPIILVISSIIPLAAVVLLIMAFMGKFDKAAHDLTNGAFGNPGDVKTYDLSDGRTITVSDTMDLYELIGAPEDLIESIYECEKSESGYYPSDDKITFLCMDGYVYLIKIDKNDRYNFLGVSLSSDVDNLNEKFLNEFSLADESPISDGQTRRAYVSVNGNGLVNIDFDESGIKAIGWTGENVEINDQTTSEEDKDEDVLSNNNSTTIPDYCEIVFEDEYGSITYNNTNSGYYFGIADNSSKKIRFSEPEEYNEIISKLAEMSEYTQVEIVYFEEDDRYDNLDEVFRMYLNDMYNDDYYSMPAFIILAEFFRNDGTIDYSIKASDSIWDYFTEDGFMGICAKTQNYDRPDVGFVNVLVDAFESVVDDSSNQTYSEYIIDGSDSGYFDESYLYGFTADECRLARNEIYARHGKIFQDESLQQYFNSRTWYTPEYDDVPDSMLNQWELENVKTIINYEKAMGYR